MIQEYVRRLSTWRPVSCLFFVTLDETCPRQARYVHVWQTRVMKAPAFWPCCSTHRPAHVPVRKGR